MTGWWKIMRYNIELILILLAFLNEPSYYVMPLERKTCWHSVVVEVSSSTSTKTLWQSLLLYISVVSWFPISIVELYCCYTRICWNKFKVTFSKKCLIFSWNSLFTHLSETINTRCCFSLLMKLIRVIRHRRRGLSTKIFCSKINNATFITIFWNYCARDHHLFPKVKYSLTGYTLTREICSTSDS